MKEFIKRHKSIVLCVVVLITLVGVIFGTALNENDNVFVSKNKNEYETKSEYTDEDVIQDSDGKADETVEVENKADFLNNETHAPALSEQTDAENADEAYCDEKAAETENIDEQKEGCELVIDCSTINKYSGKKKHEINIPENGMLCDISGIKIGENETAFDVLIRELDERNIKIDYEISNFGGAVYILGIDGIKEFDCGRKSGWLYKINGEFPTKSLNEYVLNPNDKIELIYTCDMGNDV